MSRRKPSSLKYDHGTMNDPQTTIDLAPLSNVISDQNHRIEELSSAAAFWQVRALQAEEQLTQKTAGAGDRAHPEQRIEHDQDTPSEFTALSESDSRVHHGIWARLRRPAGAEYPRLHPRQHRPGSDRGRAPASLRGVFTLRRH
jgi:hypothetical protein